MCVIPDGDKVADKIQLIVNLLDEEDIMIIDDNMSFTFLKISECEIGASLLR